MSDLRLDDVLQDLVLVLLRDLLEAHAHGALVAALLESLDPPHARERLDRGIERGEKDVYPHEDLSHEEARDPAHAWDLPEEEQPAPTQVRRGALEDALRLDGDRAAQELVTDRDVRVDADEFSFFGVVLEAHDSAPRCVV